jgi:DNA-binding PucR family transcriptional regulator
MRPDRRFRDLVLRYTADPEWLPSVSRDITDAIYAELPALDADADVRRGTYATTESVLRLLVYMVRNEVPPREAEPPPAAVDSAREFVRQGFPLDSLIRAYHIGQATFFRRWVAAASRADDPDDRAYAIEVGALWTFDYIEALSAGIVRRYAEERERWVRSAAAVRSQAVEALLSGDPVDVGATSSRLRYDLGREHLAFVVWHAAPAATGDEALATLERAALQLAGALTDGRPLLVPRARLVIAGWIGYADRPDSSALDRLTFDTRRFPAVRSAFGSPGRGVAGFCRSHREALHARRIAEVTNRRPGVVTWYRQVALASLASVDIAQAREFVAAELGPLAAVDDDKTARLAGTLRVYLEENMSPRRTATRLGVHENTITNRIRAAQEQLADPIEQRACELQVALRLVGLARGD